MKAAIITIGTELVIGSVVNTNSAYLAEKLTDQGVHVSYHISLRDDFEDIKSCIEEYSKKVDLIFLCGGLGPTKDDMTKEVLANFLDKDLILDEKQYQKLIDRSKKRKYKLTENNKKQAIIIESSLILDNNHGQAPGEVLEKDKVKYFLLPGPPNEFKGMVDEYIVNLIDDDSMIFTKSINVKELGESRVESMIRELDLEDSDVSINTFAKFKYTEIKILAEGKDKLLLQKKVDFVSEILFKKFEAYIYDDSDKKSESEKLVDILKAKDLKISFAESMTGGLLASMITKISGASQILKNSIVCYSNLSKHKILNVSEDTLNKYGAVSKETAYEMAKGLNSLGMSQINVSVTGEAGPICDEKPVGTVYVCYYYSDLNYKIEKYDFSGNRNEIQMKTANKIISTLIKDLQED